MFSAPSDVSGCSTYLLMHDQNTLKLHCIKTTFYDHGFLWIKNSDKAQEGWMDHLCSLMSEDSTKTTQKDDASLDTSFSTWPLHVAWASSRASILSVVEFLIWQLRTSKIQAKAASPFKNLVSDHICLSTQYTLLSHSHGSALIQREGIQTPAFSGRTVK